MLANVHLRQLKCNYGQTKSIPHHSLLRANAWKKFFLFLIIKLTKLQLPQPNCSCFIQYVVCTVCFHMQRCTQTKTVQMNSKYQIYQEGKSKFFVAFLNWSKREKWKENEHSQEKGNVHLMHFLLFATIEIEMK